MSFKGIKSTSVFVFAERKIRNLQDKEDAERNEEEISEGRRMEVFADS